MTAHLGGGEGRGLAGVVHDGRAVGEPDEHEGAAADAAGGRADHAEAQRGGHGRVHGAAAVAERVAAGPRAPTVVRRHGAVRRRHHLPAPRGRRRGSGGDQEEEEGERRGDRHRPLKTSGCRSTVGTGELSKPGIIHSALHCTWHREKETKKIAYPPWRGGRRGVRGKTGELK